MTERGAELGYHELLNELVDEECKQEALLNDIQAKLNFNALGLDRFKNITPEELGKYIYADVFFEKKPKTYSEMKNLLFLNFSLRAAMQHIGREDVNKYNEKGEKNDNGKTIDEHLKGWGGLTNEYNKDLVIFLQNIVGAYPDGLAGPQTVWKVLDKLGYDVKDSAEGVNNLYRNNEKFQVMSVGTQTIKGKEYKFDNSKIKFGDGTNNTYKFELDEDGEFSTKGLKIVDGWIVEDDSSIIPKGWKFMNKKDKFGNFEYKINDIKYLVNFNNFPKNSIVKYDNYTFYNNGRVFDSSNMGSWSISKDGTIKITMDNSKNITNLGKTELDISDKEEKIVGNINDIPNSIDKNNVYIIKNTKGEKIYEFYSSRFIGYEGGDKKEGVRDKINKPSNITILKYSDDSVDFAGREELAKSFMKYNISDNHIELLQNILMNFGEKEIYGFDKQNYFKKGIQKLSNGNSLGYYVKGGQIIEIFKDKGLTYNEYSLWDKKLKKWIKMGNYQAGNYVISENYKNLV